MSAPMYWLFPADAENIDDEDNASARSIGAGVTVELVEETGELLPYQRPDLFVARLKQRLRGSKVGPFLDQVLDAQR